MGRLATEFGSYEGQDSDGHGTEVTSRGSDGFFVGKGTYTVNLAWEADPTGPSVHGLRVGVIKGYMDRTLLVIWSVGLLVVGLILALAKRSHWHQVLVDAGLREDDDD